MQKRQTLSVAAWFGDLLMRRAIVFSVVVAVLGWSLITIGVA